jgi:uncharacterized protein (DUF427 family)
MKAMWNGQVIAEAPNDELIEIEGNYYFPPKSVHWQFFSESEHHTNCPWKGEASYYDINVDEEVNDYGAWYYPEPKPSAIKKVGKDFSNYVAFWLGVKVVE